MGLKLNRDYMSEMSKCNTAQLWALPPWNLLHCSISAAGTDAPQVGNNYVGSKSQSKY